MTSSLKFIFSKIIFFPECTVTITSSDPSFTTPEIKHMLRRKNKLMQRGKVEEAGSLATKIGALITKKNTTQLNNIDHKSGAKNLWEKVRIITHKKPTIPMPDNITADLLNTHYASMSRDLSYTVPDVKATVTKPLSISEYQTFYALDHLKHTSTGPDGLPAWFLKLSAPVSAKPVSTLFNLAINNSIFPDQWETAFITPIAKITSPTVPADYRNQSQ